MVDASRPHIPKQGRQTSAGIALRQYTYGARSHVPTRLQEGFGIPTHQEFTKNL
jgi:hypothetical protein